MFSCQFYEKWVSVRERNIKLLLETVTYIATTGTVTCIITIELVTCIMHRRKCGEKCRVFKNVEKKTSKVVQGCSSFTFPKTISILRNMLH